MEEGSAGAPAGLTVFSSARTIEATIVTGSGSVAGGGTFIPGSSVTLTATPDAGYVFIAWSGDATGSVNPLTLTIERDMNVGAIFIEPTGLVPQASYDAVVAERDARPTAEQLAAVEAERDALPTQAAYDAVAAERDARFTEDQIHAMSADYTMGLNDAGNVEIKIFFIKSADLQAFTPFTVNPESVSVVDGKICLEFPSEDRAFFFRFRVE